jgi:hypothetical protein
VTMRAVSLLIPVGVLLLILLALPATAQEEDKQLSDPFPEATRLKDEARVFFNQSGDPDRSHQERRKSRGEAYSRLVKARILLDAWIEVHGEESELERLDDIYVDIAGMMYWLRKDSQVGELPPYPPADPADATGPVKPTEPEAAKPPKPPEPPKPPSPAEVFGKIKDYEKKFPGDVPGLHERYKRFLVNYPDTSTTEYEAAATRLADLGERLKDVYRLARDDDPDSLKNVDDSDVLKLIRQLSADLEDGSDPVRERAARFLGGLGSGKAAGPLMASLKREDPGHPVFMASADALARIGGRRVCAKVMKVKPTSELSPTVVEILITTVEGGGVKARIAGEALAVYVADRPIPERVRATEVLFKAGGDGALGLSMALNLAPVEKKDDYIEHLGEIADPRTAGNLARFLVVNPTGARRKQHRAARKAIEKIGLPGVRYLIPVLDEERYMVWTAEMLRQICGVKLKNDKRRTWEKWYRKNRRKLEKSQ